MRLDALRARIGGHAAFLLAIAAVHAVNAVIVLTAWLRYPGGRVDPVMAGDGFLLLAGLVGLFLVADALRRGRFVAAWAAGGLAVTLALGTLLGGAWVPGAGWRPGAFTDDILEGAALWAAFVTPLALLAAYAPRDARAATGAVAAAFLVFLGAWAPDRLLYHAAQVSAEPAPWVVSWAAFTDAWKLSAGVVAQCAFSAALAAGVIGTSRPLTAPAPVRSGRVQLTGWWVAGVVVLALSWGFGGTFFMFIPLWLIGLGLIVVPPLVRWQRAPVPAAGTVGLLGVGALPVFGPCVAQGWTDVADQHIPPVDVTVRLAELATRGPAWATGGGFGGESITCGGWLLALAIAWIAAVAGLAAWRPVSGQADT